MKLQMLQYGLYLWSVYHMDNKTLKGVSLPAKQPCTDKAIWFLLSETNLQPGIDKYYRTRSGSFSHSS